MKFFFVELANMKTTKHRSETFNLFMYGIQFEKKTRTISSTSLLYCCAFIIHHSMIIVLMISLKMWNLQEVEINFDWQVIAFL
jgi:hypothetical protein